MTTAANNEWSALTAPQALARYAPTAAAALDTLIAATATIDGDARSVALVRALCANTLSLPALPHTTDPLFNSADWRNSETIGDDECVLLAFAEQFSIDVSSIDDDLRAAFLNTFGSTAFAVAMSIYIADITPRLRRALEQIFCPDPAGWPALNSHSESATDSNPAFQEFIRVVYNMRGLDPVITELVRLRGARQHQCRLCKSLRAHSALAAGADEAAFAAIDDYANSSFSARQKSALALTDAIIWQPAHISAAVIADIRSYFTPAEAVELILDIMRNAANKSAVALAADAPIGEDVQVYDIDEAGNMHFGIAAPGTNNAVSAA
jgi:alkylhydroperoxidase family enzyme